MEPDVCEPEVFVDDTVDGPVIVRVEDRWDGRYADDS
jgi:hypothetical protein